MSIYNGCRVKIEVPERDHTKDISETFAAEFPGIEMEFSKSDTVKRASVKSFYVPKGHALDGAMEFDMDGSNAKNVSGQGLFLAAQDALKKVPSYFYVRIMDYKPPGFDRSELTAYLRSTHWKDVALGYGQTYGIIKTPEPLNVVLARLAALLSSEDSLAVDEIQPYDGPYDETGVTVRARNRPTSEMKRVRDLSGRH